LGDEPVIVAQNKYKRLAFLDKPKAGYISAILSLLKVCKVKDDTLLFYSEMK